MLRRIPAGGDANTVSAAVGVVSAAHTSLVSDVGRISLDVSAISTRLSGLSDAHTSLVNRVSANSGGGSVTSVEVVDAVSVEAANRTSADNVLSVAVAAVSAAHTSLVSDVGRVSLNLSALSTRADAVSAAAAGASAAAAAVSAAHVSLVSDVGRLSLAVSVLSTALSVLSDSHTSLVNRVSANSGVGGVGSVTSAEVVNSTSVEAANRVSADNLISAAVAAVSADLTSVKAAHTSLVSDLLRVSLNVSVLSTRADTVSAAAAAAAAAAAGASAAAAAVSAAQTSLASDVGRVSLNVSVLSTRADTVSAAVAAVSANLTSLGSDVGRLSNAISLFSSQGNILSLQNQDTSAVSAGAPVYAFTSANTFKRGNASVVAAKHLVGLVIDAAVAISAFGRVQTAGVVTLTTGQWDAVTGQAGGLTAGTIYYLDVANGLLKATVPVTGAARPVGVAISTTQLQLQIAGADDLTSALLAVSANLTSLGSDVGRISLNVSVLSTRADTVSAAAAGASAAAAAVSASHTSLVSDVGRISLAVSALSTAVSALSDAHTSLVNRVSANSVAASGSVTSAEVVNSTSVEAANRVSADNVISAAVAAVSAAHTSLVSDLGRISLNVSVLSTRADTVSAAAAAASAAAAGASAAAAAVSLAHTSLVSDIGRISLNASAMSTAINVVSAAHVSLVSDVGRISLACSAISTAVQTISAGLGGVQMRWVSTANVITGSTITNISGMSLSVAANATYEIGAKLMFNMSALTAIGFGLSYPTMAAGAFNWFLNLSAAVGSALSTPAFMHGYVMESAAAANSNALHISAAAPGASAGFTYLVKMSAMMNTSAAGTVQMVVRQSMNAVVVLKGSYMRAFRII